MSCRRTLLTSPLAALAVAVAGLAGCPDSVGIICPPGDPSCNPDLAAPVPDLAVPPIGDLAVGADLAPGNDLTPGPDMTPCVLYCEGCCDDQGACQKPSVATCGWKGAACMGCDPSTADTCTDKGCSCGTNPACASGQRCFGSTCVCDSLSCPQGCCDANARCTPFALATCSNMAGAMCGACKGDVADGCSPPNGCTCGNGPACVHGQHCVMGACVCDGMACAGGCCAGNVCTSPTAATCGTNGMACTQCNGEVADSCVMGQCACGAGKPCVAGQRCVGGRCVCDAQSCPAGCCANGACLGGGDVAACGAGGNACVTCPNGQACVKGVCAGCNQTCANGCCAGNACIQPSAMACGGGGAACLPCEPGRADSCVGGVCRCGGAAQCPPGNACVNGVCVCNAQSCANGCCQNNQCMLFNGGNGLCGAGGGACQKCDPLVSNSCVNGVCSCGPNPACGANLQCVNNQCVCGPQSCPNGCCLGNLCINLLTQLNCGLGGALCQACPQGQVCGKLGKCGCPQGQWFCPASKTCVADCAACMGAGLACNGNGACVPDCGKNCGGTFACANTCVTSCKDNCNGAVTCLPSACILDCAACANNAHTCEVSGARTCMAACQGCAGNCQ